MKKIIWRPNNYRRELKVKVKKKEHFEHLNRVTPLYEVNKQSKVITFDYQRIKVLYYKKCLVGIWSQEKRGKNKVTYLLDDPNRLEDKKEEIRAKIDNALIEVARKLNIIIPFNKPFWVRHEDFIKGEEYIDNIPKDMVIHDTAFKKVYEKGVEFIGGLNESPTAKVKNYLKNRAIEDFKPEFLRAIEQINPLRALMAKCKTIQDILDNKQLLQLLTDNEKKEFTLWTFENIGGV